MIVTSVDLVLINYTLTDPQGKTPAISG
jgi:hypothetical protein